MSPLQNSGGIGNLGAEKMLASCTPGIYGGPIPTPSWADQASYKPGAAFRIEKIENGFLVHLAPSEGSIFERHYAADEKAVGELVTATLVRWFIEGK